jgi:hypothetical protein
MSETGTDHAAELRRMSRKCIPSNGPWGDIPATMVQAAAHINELRVSLAAVTRERDEARDEALEHCIDLCRVHATDNGTAQKIANDINGWRISARKGGAKP